MRYTRHDELPVYERRAAQLSASHYNTVRVAFRRLGAPLRLPLPGLKHLDLILQEDAWIIVDRAHNDMAVAAWCELEDAGRSDLSAPVACRVRLFHAHAGLILTRALALMDDLLRETLSPVEAGDVIPLIDEG